jgi:imidazoleglycerol phosphate synthase cyclase subunit
MRIISRIDYKNGNVIKGRRFEGFRKVGTVHEVVEKHYSAGASEFLFYDCVAALFGNAKLLDEVSSVSSQIFSPVTAGGGIRTGDQADLVFKSGADRIALNTSVFENPALVKKVARKYGNQSIVAMLEVKKISGTWQLFKELGREPIFLSLERGLDFCLNLGVGEVCLTAVDHDGLMKGFPQGLLGLIPDDFPIPIVLSGGISQPCHIDLLMSYRNKWLSGVAIGTAFHFDTQQISRFNGKYLP